MAIKYRRLRVRRGHTAKWKESNPVLKLGEVAADLDLKRIKIGDGVKAYNDLDYMYDELSFFIGFILKIIGSIEGSGKLLDSVQTTSSFVNEIEDPEQGDIVYVKVENQFYYYDGEKWVLLLFDKLISNIPISTENIQDLNNKFSLTPKGTSIFVIEDSHIYIKGNNNIWIKQANEIDTMNTLSVISKSDLDNLTDVKDGAIVFVLSEKKYYSFNGTKFVKNKIL